MRLNPAGRLLLVLVIAMLALVPTMNAQTKNYVILATGQGKGSTAFAQQLGPALVKNLASMGIVLARSADPNFATWASGLTGVQSVTEDISIVWIDQNEPNVAADPATVTNANAEKYSPIQWNIRAIHADESANLGFRGNNKVRARVAIVDSGIITEHPDIAPNLNLALSTSFVPGEPLDPPSGVFNHGTHVAGIVAAVVNGSGVRGVAPEAELVAVKVLSSATGSGPFTQIIEGIDYASGPLVHADVINMSLGAFWNMRPTNPGDNKGGVGSLFSALNRAINAATQRGTLVISAAGNNGANLNSSYVNVPGQSGNGIAIAATAPVGWAYTGDAGADFGRPASYTNYGQSVVDLAAPGGDDAYPGNENCTVAVLATPPEITRPCWVFDMVISPGTWTDLGGGVKSFSYNWAAGTSMATPHVSGVAALIVGVFGHMSPAQLKSRLDQTATDIGKPGADAFSGHGQVDALAAVTAK